MDELGISADTSDSIAVRAVLGMKIRPVVVRTMASQTSIGRYRTKERRLTFRCR
eukprot:NODE_14921_length_166_cov_0.871795_g13761_i0.p3 GENE.NODE_14921_length_166_cov_0.871795_g13761_i0~~NODE_14921_length_166_cov_0.871795_g13761_i0.p3  ORF type:complete len:54 (+),score=12.56 NODE_14921_length_166_cov_0.871795_g13761_i0:2-163(+)